MAEDTTPGDGEQQQPPAEGEGHESQVTGDGSTEPQEPGDSLVDEPAED